MVIDARPKKLPLKELQHHIDTLIKEHTLNVKWRCTNAIYDVRTGIVNLRNIKSCRDYITDLHEIGHSLCPVVEKAHKQFNKLDEFIESIKNLDVNAPISHQKIT